MTSIRVLISSSALSLEAAVKSVSDPAHGATDTFIGTVRNTHEGKSVTGITYDVHEDLAKRAFHDICLEGQGKWPGTRYYVAHHHGTLDIGGISIVIAVSSAHRAESFAACRYVIEEIKKRVPIWKQEHYLDGMSEWLPGHSLYSRAETLAGSDNS
ncbi:MAG: molybdenum cofactor biosynthesis protein MoaE [Alphaproteobacteria bacterium]|nr:molybdenum cofactor biosynthesis protein MoaE [Alphaproteobacteria bacterium]MCB9975419.1 molybdenum cofactor biosynthesis protein MoaE [Rhodospirillales bacterium]